MRYKKNILFKRFITLIFILFSLFIAGAVYFIFESSKKMDQQHVQVISLAADLDVKILKTRVIIDDCLLKNEPVRLQELNVNIDNIESEFEKLNLIFTEEFKRIDNNDLEDFINEYKIISDKLLFFRKSIENSDLTEVAILELFNNFYLSYSKFGEFVHRYLYDNTDSYEKEMFALVLVLIIFMVIAGCLIVQLINKLIISDRRLIQKTIVIESRERKRIAADLHDGLGAYLSGLIMHIEVLEKECEGNPQLESKTAYLNKLARHAIQSVEEIINNLNPSYLSRLGLAKTLEKTIVKINSLEKTQFEIDSSKFDLKLIPSIEIMFYRICTELINNALKHSSAKKATITLYNQKRKIYLQYEDNGVGFQYDDSSREDNQTGLYNLATRVESVGGNYEIESKPGKGVRIKISVSVN